MHVCICAAVNDGSDALAEPCPDQLQCGPATLIFYGIVEQSRDCFILISTMRDNETRHRQQVGDVRSFRPFPCLGGMKPCCKGQGLFEAMG